MDDVVFKPSLQPKQSGDNTTKRKSDSILVDQARRGATLVKGPSEVSISVACVSSSYSKNSASS